MPNGIFRQHGNNKA
jgi:hypothetical protein